MNAHNRPRLLDYDAAQAYLGNISRSTMKTLVGRGEIEPIAVGTRRTAFDCDDRSLHRAPAYTSARARD